ncbi:MAG: aminotransferase class V-fold PLP-dependent enzyme [Muribaculaceae bacterium]
MSIDIDNISSDFPILKRQLYRRRMVYLDHAATSLTPECVVNALAEGYRHRKANVHRGVHTLSQEATETMEATRRKVAAYIHAADTAEIVFTRGTTEALNLVAASYGSLLSEGDEVVVTAMEHHSNIVPWQLLQQRRGVKLRVVPFDDKDCLRLDVLEQVLNERTRIVSIAHASNVLGTVNPIAEVAAIVRRHCGRQAVVCVDGAQAVAHTPVDVSALDVDFYAFSAHKMYGPTGVGVLYGRRALLEAMPPYQGGGEMIGHVSFDGTTWAELPYKFEAGTPDFVGIAAFGTAIDYVSAIGLDAIAAHEHDLLSYAEEQLRRRLPQLRIFGHAPHKSAVISFQLGSAHHYDVGLMLDKLGIEVRTGHHCAQPLMDALGIEGTVRASFGLYNTRADVDALVAALERIAPMLL